MPCVLQLAQAVSLTPDHFPQQLVRPEQFQVHSLPFWADRALCSHKEQRSY